MNYRKIITIAGIAIIILMAIIAALIRNDTLRMLTVLGVLTIISLIAIGVGAILGKTKVTYQITGPIIAWFLAHQVWYLWSPETFRIATDTASFWAFEIAFLVIFLALLGRIKAAVLFIRVATVLLLLVSFGSLMANFIEGGPKLMSETKNNIRRTTAQGQIIEIKDLDKQRRADPFLARLKELKNKSKEKPLSKSEHSELQRINRELEKIYPKPTPEVKQLSSLTKPRTQRHLSGIFRIPPKATVVSDIYGNKIGFLRNERVILIVTNGSYNDLVWVNKNIPSIQITQKRTFIRGISPGMNHVKLMNNGDKDIFVDIRVKPKRV